jgi:hypothetical protein
MIFLLFHAFAKKPPPKNTVYVDSCLSSIMWHPSCACISKNEMHGEMSVDFERLLVLNGFVVVCV